MFDTNFKQNSPQIFCLAALCGIAIANQFETVLAIKHAEQIAYDKIYDVGFRNSYSMLWEKFGAVELNGGVYRLNVPLDVPPLKSVGRLHRRRAAQRRAYWSEITQSAHSVMNRYRIASNS